MESILQDKHGRRFRLDVEKYPTLLTFDLKHSNRKVGYAWCVIEEDGCWRLSELQIKDDVPKPLVTFGARLKQVLGFKRPTENYRRHGLGTALLQAVIDYARLKQAKCIRGSVVQEDLDTNPNLIRWYEKHGFKQVEPSSGDVTKAVAALQLDLK